MSLKDLEKVFVEKPIKFKLCFVFLVPPWALEEQHNGVTWQVCPAAPPCWFYSQVSLTSCGNSRISAWTPWSTALPVGSRGSTGHSSHSALWYPHIEKELTTLPPTHCAMGSPQPTQEGQQPGRLKNPTNNIILLWKIIGLYYSH